MIPNSCEWPGVLLPTCRRQRRLLQALAKPRQIETGSLHDSVPLQALHVLHQSRASCGNSASVCLTVFASQPNIRGALHVRRGERSSSPCVSVKFALGTRKQSISTTMKAIQECSGGFVNMLCASCGVTIPRRIAPAANQQRNKICPSNDATSAHRNYCRRIISPSQSMDI
jgi:hypothetical protein